MLDIGRQISTEHRLTTDMNQVSPVSITPIAEMLRDTDINLTEVIWPSLHYVNIAFSSKIHDHFWPLSVKEGVPGFRIAKVNTQM
jgi:hypothetical protein